MNLCRQIRKRHSWQKSATATFRTLCLAWLDASIFSLLSSSHVLQLQGQYPDIWSVHFLSCVNTRLMADVSTPLYENRIYKHRRVLSLKSCVRNCRATNQRDQLQQCNATSRKSDLHSRLAKVSFLPLHGDCSVSVYKLHVRSLYI